jgi:hypothetical protein
MKGWGETVERTGMQQWHKGPRPEIAATRQKWSEGPRWQMVTISEEEEDNHGWHPGVEPRRVSTSGKWRNTQENMI